MRILLSGATGFVGSEVAAALRARGDAVVALSRKASNPETTRTWNPDSNELEPSAVSGFDAVVHLAGEPILGLWTASKRQRIRESRVNGTQLLARTIAALPAEQRPHTYISASAVGYYGGRGNELLTESSSPGSGFLPDTCVAWEQASTPLTEADVRVVWMRIGIVLDPAGGALKQMLMPFKLGVGGKLGSGQQWMSWISRGDLVAAILFALDNNVLTGPVNATAPNAVTNSDFTKQVAAALHRPAILPAPSAVLRLLPGNMAEEAILASARVVPTKLREAGFQFQDPDLSNVLARL